MLAEGPRTFASVAIIIFLSLLFAGWLTSSSMGVSPMLDRLHGTVLQPLNALLLTESCEFNPVTDQRDQLGAIIRATIDNPDGTTTVRFFPDPEHLTDRHQQYLQHLANLAADYATYATSQDESKADGLMRIIGSAILQETDSKKATLRCYFAPNDPEAQLALFRMSPEERVAAANLTPDGPRNYEILITATVETDPGSLPIYTRNPGSAQTAPPVKKSARGKSLNSAPANSAPANPGPASAAPADSAAAPKPKSNRDFSAAPPAANDPATAPENSAKP